MKDGSGPGILQSNVVSRRPEVQGLNRLVPMAITMSEIREVFYRK